MIRLPGTVTIVVIATAVGGLMLASHDRLSRYAQNKPVLVAQTSAEDFYNRGVTRASAGDYRGAVEDFTQALRVNPNAAEAYMGRGFARAELKDYPAAIEDFTQALRINPNEAEAYIARGFAR